MVDGQTAGPLCARDLKLHRIDPAQLECLQALAHAVVALLMRRLAATPS